VGTGSDRFVVLCTTKLTTTTSASTYHVSFLFFIPAANTFWLFCFSSPAPHPRMAASSVGTGQRRCVLPGTRKHSGSSSSPLDGNPDETATTLLHTRKVQRRRDRQQRRRRRRTLSLHVTIFPHFTRSQRLVKDYDGETFSLRARKNIDDDDASFAESLL
jgi:hypothetical protein